MFVFIIYLLLTSYVGVQGAGFKLLKNRAECLYHDLVVSNFINYLCYDVSTD
jgi:hypothetical protein